MSSPQNSSLINEYSSVFTTLQAGKKQLIQWGAESVPLNRYIVDAAGSTAVCDPGAVIQTIDLAKVSEGETETQRSEYCVGALKRLVALQEEALVLQKSAKESGISAGLLTIVGQAATQSPNDNGASVLRQLGELVDEDQNAVDESIPVVNATGAKPAADIAVTPVLEDLSDSIDLQGSVANDTDTFDFERLTPLQQLTATMRAHWQALLVDASVCIVAIGLAISLVN